MEIAHPVFQFFRQERNYVLKERPLVPPKHSTATIVASIGFSATGERQGYSGPDVVSTPRQNPLGRRKPKRSRGGGAMARPPAAQYSFSARARAATGTSS